MRKYLAEFAYEEYTAKYGDLVGLRMARIVMGFPKDLLVTTAHTRDQKRLVGFAIYEKTELGIMIGALCGRESVIPHLEKFGQPLIFVSIFEEEQNELKKKGRPIVPEYSDDRQTAFIL
jgi:hypothetical protein